MALHLKNRFLITAASLALALVGSAQFLGGGGASARTASADPQQGWYGTWRAAPQQPAASGMSHDGFSNETVRMVVHTTASGNSVRLRFSNAYGTQSVVIGKVEVALHKIGPTVDPATEHGVTFGGQDSVTIPVGDEVVSDPVPMRVGAEHDLVVSEFLPDATGPATWHSEAESTTYVSAPGDWTAEPGGSPYQSEIPSWFYLDGVDVARPAPKGTIVAFGDSITDGHYSTIDANARWPNWLALRVPEYAVLNEGIGGNRILTDTSSSGESALRRFNRDVLSQPHVTDVIFLEGINDIGAANTTGPYASADQIIAGMQQIISEAHSRGIRIFGGTLTPFEGASYYNAAGEAEREAVNHWIRTSGAFDGVIDFDAAVRDPSDPLRLNPLYDAGGGHLHPNDLGYKAMTDAIDLTLLTASRNQH
jgi:lysophospholipase L1-like esterase